MKRYSIFVSSTKTDLEPEREAIIKAVIELGHMPASMEYFPASNRDSWSYIEKVIDDCDYYVLIVGAKYGSIDKETGLSFTEREYRYARTREIPTIAFLHHDPDELPGRYHDNKTKLKKFYDYVKSDRLCRFWKNQSDLATMATTSLIQLINNHPRPGWIKADMMLLNAYKHPASSFVESNVVSHLTKPYRENAEARVEYSRTDDQAILLVADEVTFKCRAFNGNIDKKISWSFEPDEFYKMISMAIKIKKPTGEQQTILQKDDFHENLPQDGFKFSHEITDEWNVDNLLVIIEGHYNVLLDHFESWELPVLTNGFALTITYPKDLKIFHMPYLNAWEDSNVTEREGFFSYKLYTWVLPNEGIGWQFYKEELRPQK